MSSHIAKHAVKRKLELSPRNQDNGKVKKFQRDDPAPIDSNDQDCHGDGNLKKSILIGEEQDPVWSEDHYKTEIIANLLVRETVRMPLGCRSSYVPHRHRIIDWMSRAKEALRLCDEVHQLAIYFFDRFVNGASSLFLGDRLELYVLCCIQLAAKTLEWDNRIPRNSDLNKLLERPFDLSEYTAVERRLLLFFQWNVTIPVVNTFMGLFRSYLLENSGDACVRHSLLQYAAYFETTTVRHAPLQTLPPSLTASAIVFTSRALAQVEPAWPRSLASIVQYKDLDLLPNVGLLTKLLNNDNGDEATMLKREHLRKNSYVESDRHWRLVSSKESNFV